MYCARMKKISHYHFATLSAFILCQSISTSFALQEETIKMLWVPTNRQATTNVLVNHIKNRFQVIKAPFGVNASEKNPFHGTYGDFDRGTSRPRAGEAVGDYPKVNAYDASWFDGIAAQENLPKIFQIGGHHVIADGWEDGPEDWYIFAPTLRNTLAQYPKVKKVFDHIKLALLWGCNTLTNLEPHGPNGEYLSPEEIRRQYESGNSGKRRMLGLEDGGDVTVNTLEFYKQRLAREYGPNNHEGHFFYTRDASRERCVSPDGLNRCAPSNLDRIFPDSYLWDGSHAYNEAYQAKVMFPNARLVLGYSSASPDEETRGEHLRLTLKAAQATLNRGLSFGDSRYVNDIVSWIVSDDPSIDEDYRKQIIQEVRKNWSREYQKMVWKLHAGSITPAYPELDRDGPFVEKLTNHINIYVPYEGRD